MVKSMAHWESMCGYCNEHSVDTNFCLCQAMCCVSLVYSSIFKGIVMNMGREQLVITHYCPSFYIQPPTSESSSLCEGYIWMTILHAAQSHSCSFCLKNKDSGLAGKTALSSYPSWCQHDHWEGKVSSICIRLTLFYTFNYAIALDTFIKASIWHRLKKIIISLQFWRLTVFERLCSVFLCGWLASTTASDPLTWSPW